MKSGSNRRYLVVATLGALLLEAGATWLRSHRLGGNLIVRCRQGHLFTTRWIPAASVKSLRFGWWRFQYCPVGRHWSVVVPVRQAELSAKQLRAARDQHDIRLP
jgi:hypothetical protein